MGGLDEGTAAKGMRNAKKRTGDQGGKSQGEGTGKHSGGGVQDGAKDRGMMRK